MEIKHTFNQADLDRLTKVAVDAYQHTESFGSSVGAIESVSADYPSQFLALYAEKLANGYTLHPTMPVDFNQYGGNQFFRAYMVKPSHVQEEELKAIKAKVEAEYRAELRRQYDLHLEAMIADSVARAEREALKKQEAARQKLVEQARKDAIAALGEFDA